VSRHDEHEEVELLHRLVDLTDAEAMLLGSIESSVFAIQDSLAAVLALLSPVQATTATLSLGGSMSTLELDFTDASGTDQAAPTGDGSGLVVTFSSDGTTSVGSATAGTNSAGFVNYTAPLTVVDDGSVSNLTAVVANTSGAALLDNDGVTPFVQPPAFAFTAPAAPPAQATTATLSVTP